MKKTDRDGIPALLQAIAATPDEPKVEKKLTKREAEVIRLIAKGHLNKQIAKILQISIKTVEKHRQNAMDRLRLRNTADITRFAVANQLIKIKIHRCTSLKPSRAKRPAASPRPAAPTARAFPKKKRKPYTRSKSSAHPSLIPAPTTANFEPSTPKAKPSRCAA
ncbi:MAG: DNA-binding response regulator [Proteobacteria bacterium]|nr:DNA-binding response regulator [Pseudomonadota bacterium]